MRVFDASSMIYAWDNYPIGQFPGLWEWMAGEIQSQQVVMPDVAFEEVSHKTPECGEWLKDNDLERLEINNAVLQDAKRIKGLLGIVDDNYHPKSVGENDILIIATGGNMGQNWFSMKNGKPICPKFLQRERFPQSVRCRLFQFLVSIFWNTSGLPVRSFVRLA